MAKIEKAELDQMVKRLESQGVESDKAIEVVNILMEGTSRGYVNHGLNRVDQLVEGFLQKTVNPRAETKVLVERPAIAVWDACFGIGLLSGKKAMEGAIEKAKQEGVGIIGVINSSHLGILGYYTEMAAHENCIGIAMTTSSPAMVISGGTKKTFGTNPIAYSIPHHPFPITADFSTAKVSRGKLYEYSLENKPIPKGWAVDKAGEETTCPHEALKGGLKSLDGGIKGDLLALFVSILAGNLLGGVTNTRVKGTRYMDEKPNKGDFFMALDVKSFSDYDSFTSGVKELADFITEQNAEFRIPGQRSYENRTNFLQENF